MAVALTLKKEFLAEAILAKSTPLYAQKDNYKGYNFKNDIFPQARFQFREYAKKYETDEEFTKYFARDLRNGDKKLFETIGSEAAKQILAGKSADEAARAQALTEEASMQGAGEASTEQQSTAGEQASTMGGGSNAPYMPSGPAIYNTPAANKAAKLQTEKTVSEEPGITQKTSESDNLKSRNSGKPSLSESFRTPRIPGSFVNAFKNFGSRLGIFFQRNVGKFLTVSNIATGVSAGIGAVAGAGFGPLGVGAGALGGSIGSRFMMSSDGVRFMGRIGNGIINVGSSISNQVGRRFKVPKIPGVGRKKAWLLLLPFLAFTLLAGILGALNPSGMPTGSATSSIVALASDISQCKFTRANVSGPIKSKILQGWISEVASKENVPVGVMASVTMHENPNFVLNADNNHDGIKNNYYYIASRVNEGTNKNTNAVGLYQISTGQTPVYDSQGNIMGIEDHCKSLLLSGILKRAADKLGKKVYDSDYYCVSDFDERIRRLCQTDRTERNRPYYAPDKAADDSYVNLCNLKDNIMVGAEFLNNKINGGSWSDINDLKSAIKGFYGGCNYGGGDYCAEVATDSQACVPSTLATGPSGSVPTEKLDQIVYWAEKIAANLDKNSSDRLLTSVVNGSYSTGNYSSGGYQCTYLVVDSYNLAGITGLTIAGHGAVTFMENFWRSTANYLFLDYQKSHQIINNIHPGYAMFEQLDPGRFTGKEHVSIVKERNIDSNGTGTILTINSNSGKYIYWPYPVHNWIIENNFVSDPLQTITGFGGIQSP